MDPDKQGNSSEASSEELKEESSSGSTPRRSYECTFCRRGFTNAQALGGHMNIHRKDRAKENKHLNPSIPNKNYNSSEPYIPSSILTPPQTNLNPYYPVFESERNYHNMYQNYHHHPSSAATYAPHEEVHYPPSVYSNYSAIEQHDFLAPMSNMSSHQDQLLGENLSLRIGSSSREDDNDVPLRFNKDADVDLELRLGHDYPC